MMDFDDIIRRALGKNKERERARVVATLTPSEKTALMLVLSKRDAFDREFNAMGLRKKKIQLELEEWWARVRTDHKLDHDSLSFDDEEGVIYEMKEKD
jgi:hypothetical protein